jgi:hypothetical protein
MHTLLLLHRLPAASLTLLEQPSWASVNNGVLICTACSGVHRSLGVQHSFIQSLKLDTWTRETVQLLLQSPGTSVVNTQLEHHVPPAFPKPTQRSSREVREAFITAKYPPRPVCHRPPP